MRCSNFVLAQLLLGAVVHAQTPPEPLAWPPGYFNARTATDAAKPQPAATVKDLKLARTHHSISIEWHIDGDTDHDAACKVSYKRDDESAWHEAMPLMRVDYFGWYDTKPAAKPFNMLAGSILFLRPGAVYQVRLTLSDPDSAAPVEETKRIQTKPWPNFAKPARTLHVMPLDQSGSSGDGSAEKPFRGLKPALAAAKPGDLFLLHAGGYGETEINISGVQGTVEASTDQTRYIGFKAAGDGDAVFHQLRASGSHLWFEGLTFKRGDSPNGLKGGEGCENVVVSGCTFRDFHYSVFLSKGCAGWHIANNDILGDTVKGISGEGVELNKSSGHTVCYNRIGRSADGISYPNTNCDLFGNDIFDMSDDPIEPDYGYANIRIWGNRLHGHTGITFQPMYCGPWYIVRNHCISKGNVFKLRVQDRFVCVNNTFAAWSVPVPHAHGLLTSFSRNNIWMHLGGSEFLWQSNAQTDDKKRSYSIKYVLYDSPVANWKTDVDHDGFEFSAAKPMKGKMNPWMLHNQRYYDLPSLNAAIGIEAHGRVLDRAKDFVAFTVSQEMPGKDAPLIKLSAQSQGKDAGVTLPNIAEEFDGQSPDLGAFESTVPHFGPRDDPAAVPLQWVLKHQR
ncbi:MAG: hypothetical protein ACKVY0_07120 [Prosthecobacter sp.]|uniref:hypothetical protein n=1 Tax=Prosthecobacter sp. TaxID=1965333 RepID=UPI0038FD7093